MRQTIRKLVASIPVLDSAFRRLVWSRIHFPEMELRALSELPSGSVDVAIDVGAALGSYTWVLSRKARDVFAFEPGDLHYRNLSAANWGSRVTAVKAAVGAAPGTMDLLTPGDDNDARHQATLSEANPVVGNGPVARTPVTVHSIDDYLASHLDADRHVDVLKIDVEGFENAVIDGALSTIKKHRPIVIAEIEARHNPDFRHVFDVLAELGYSVFAWRNGTFGPIAVDEIAQMEAPEDFRNDGARFGAHSNDSYVNNFVFQHRESRLRLVQT